MAKKASKASSKTKRQAIVVLGMHRSGTSAFSGVLSLLGCDGPGHPMAASAANPKGFFESQEIYNLHGKIFTSADSSWSDWRPLNETWFNSAHAKQYQQRAIDTLTQEFADSRLFVFKDPRVCRLVPFWLDTLKAMGSNPLFLHIHRNPLDVVSSLMKHHDLTTDHCLLLWLRHVLDAERFTRGMPRHFVSYARFLDNWARDSARLQEGLGISLPRQSNRVTAEVNEFLEGALRHFDTPPEKVLEDSNMSEWIRSSYAIMERWAIDGESPEDYAALDRTRHAFDQAAPAMSMIASNRDSTRLKLRQIETAGSDLRKQVTDLESLVSTEKANAAAARAEAEALSDTLAKARMEHDAHIAALEVEISDTKEVAQSQRTAANDLRDALEQQQLLLRERIAERDSIEVNLSRLKGELADTGKRLAETDAHRIQEQEAVRQLAEAPHTIKQERLAQTDLKSDLEKARAEAQRNADQLSESAKELLASQQRVIPRDADLQKRFQELATMTRLVQELEDRIEAERQHRERVEYDNLALQASHSWRLTAPIRKITRLLRRT